MNVIYLKEVGSTNDFLKNLQKGQSVLGTTAIVADTQLAGRGQMGTKWQDAPGESLLLSIGSVPYKLTIGDQFILSMAVAIAAHRFLKTVGVAAKIKWPNDLWVGRQKIGGILIENSLLHNQISSSVMGVGINLNQSTFSQNLHATSVYLQTAVTTNNHTAAAQFITQWQHVWQWVLQKQYGLIKAAYLQQLIGYEIFEVYESPNGKRFTAAISAVAPNGQLVLKELNGHEAAYDLKQVRLVP